MRQLPLLLLAAIALLYAQAPRFEAASVKPAAIPPGVTVHPGGGFIVGRGSGITIPRETGGPGTTDPGRIHYPLISVKTLSVAPIRVPSKLRRRTGPRTKSCRWMRPCRRRRRRSSFSRCCRT